MLYSPIVVLYSEERGPLESCSERIGFCCSSAGIGVGLVTGLSRRSLRNQKGRV
jgi:hypothetical protein